MLAAALAARSEHLLSENIGLLEADGEMESYDELEDGPETEYQPANGDQLISPARLLATSCPAALDTPSIITRNNLHHHSDLSQEKKQKLSQNCMH